jgi:hypothetical protein
MKTNKDIISSLKLRSKPTVPAEFFDHFLDELMHEIESNQGILGQLKKTEKPAVPDDFFAKLHDQIKNDSADKKEHLLETIPKTKRPVLPTDFFSQFEEEIIQKVSKPTKNGRIIPLPLLYILGGVAAALLLFLLTVNFNEKTGYANHENENEETLDTLVEAVIIDDYLAVMNENELIDYALENNITLVDSVESEDYDNYIDYTEDELLDYYLDL